jgi:GNAT superfamily N-acetyltransferase
LKYEIVVSREASQQDLASITAPLSEYNLKNAPPPNFKNVALLIQAQDGKAVGGLWGRAAYDWLFVEYLAIPTELRRTGMGRTLMEKAEQIALEHGCIGVWLDTFAFQARPFYEKLGYKCFGQIDDHPRGSVRYFLQKRLV